MKNEEMNKWMYRWRNEKMEKWINKSMNLKKKLKTNK